MAVNTVVSSWPLYDGVSWAPSCLGTCGDVVGRHLRSRSLAETGLFWNKQYNSLF